MIVRLISSLQLVESGILNTLLQALIFEIILFLAVPVVGLLVDSIVVRGIRGVIRKFIGGKGEYFFSNYFLLAGVVIHELSHALFALITGAKLQEVALFKPDGDSLGHVTYSTRGGSSLRALQNSLSSCAPVVTGLLILSLMVTKLVPFLDVTWKWVLAIYLFVSVLFHMNMSRADIKNYFIGAGPLCLFLLPISFLFLLFS